MKRHVRVFSGVIVKLVGLLVILSAISGCQSQSDEAKSLHTGPVFFPLPPAEPRLQFLKSFSGSDDLDKDIGRLEMFLVGDAETKETISKPFGLALSQGKLYVCDVGKRKVDVLDLLEGTFSYLRSSPIMVNPANICLEADGTKYIADSVGGAVYVFDANDKLVRLLGRDLDIKPADVTVRGQKCYVTDYAGMQVVVLDKDTGKEMSRFGKQGAEDGQFIHITGIAVNQEEHVFVTDRIKAQITEFDEKGIFQRTIGILDTGIGAFVRPKGIKIDEENRIWVVDAAAEVAKIYDPEGKLLLFFGRPAEYPGTLELPGSIALDRDHIDLFKKYAVAGAEIEFLVLISNQLGPSKINVYGFGRFPELGAPTSSAPSAPSAPSPVEEAAEPESG
ncbi:6-bladed beta-propeller [Planctomycetota bacterium]